jgi:hypothetical protein
MKQEQKINEDNELINVIVFRGITILICLPESRHEISTALDNPLRYRRGLGNCLCPFREAEKLQPSISQLNLWGTASTSNTGILERFQSKALRIIVDAPRYVPNTVIRRNLQTPTVKEEIRRYSSQYSARLSAQPNGLVVNLVEQPDNRRLRRHLPNDLPTTFLVYL